MELDNAWRASSLEHDAWCSLTCPYCGSTYFVQTSDHFPDFPELGDEITCAECSRTFVLTGKCWQEDNVI